MEFDKKVIDWGVVPHNAGKIQFEFEVLEGDIYAIAPDCSSCTYVTVSPDNRFIKGNITIDKAVEKPTTKPKEVTKLIYVWEDNGTPWFTVDPSTKVRKSGKKSVNLEIKFTVNP